LINNNTFKCPLRCDDQIAIFSDAGASKYINIVGNQIDKGYDGSKGTGGSTRSNGNCILISDCTDVIISKNVLINANSTNSGDRNDGLTGAALCAIQSSGVNSASILISDNSIYNCMWAFQIRDGVGITISNNICADIEKSILYCLPSSRIYALTFCNNYIKSGGTDAESASGCIIYRSDNTRIENNTFTQCSYGRYIVFAITAAVVNNYISVINNVVSSATDSSSLVGGFLYCESVFGVQMRLNKILWKAHRHVYLETVDDLVGMRDNVFKNHIDASTIVNGAAPGTQVYDGTNANRNQQFGQVWSTC
jgi:hypothetical protein